MKFGTLDIEKAYLGTQELDKMYLGTTEVYSKGGSAVGGIDENTLMMLHLNDNFTDSSLYASTFYTDPSSFTATYVDGLWDKKALHSQSDGVILYNSNSIVSTAMSGYTIDFWTYLDSTNNDSGSGIWIYGSSGGSMGIQIGSSFGSPVFYLNGNEITSSISTQFSTDSWHHVALEFNNTSKLESLYLDGTLSYSTTNSGLDLSTGTMLTIVQGLSSSAKIYKQELRFSNIARYNGDFTPATGPYTEE